MRMMNHATPAITARAILPRAIQTFGWYSSAELDGNTAYVPYTYDPSALDPGLSSTGIYWLDWCSTAWCDYYTTCSSGSIIGPDTAFQCNDSNNGKCVTEALLPFYGASVPLLRKVGCNAADWVTRTYYQKRPASSYNFAQPSINYALTTDPSTLTTSELSTTASSPSASLSSNVTDATASNSAAVSSSAASQSPDNGSGDERNNTGIIAGSVVGGIALIGFFVLAAIFIIRRTRWHRTETGDHPRYDGVTEHGPQTEYHEAPTSSTFAATHGELQGDSTFAKERPGNMARY